MNSTLLTTLLIGKLERFEPWSVEERQAVLDSIDTTLRLPPHIDFLREGHVPEGVHVMLDGFACGYKLLVDGRQQIISYYVPGDVCDLRNLMLPRLDYSVATLCDVQIARLAKDKLLAATKRHPRLLRALWWAALVEQSISREWIVNVGQRTAFARAAHLFCEMFVRLRAVGLVQNNSCEFPLTQTEIADTLALSTVHVNRTLTELRRFGVILRDKLLTIHDLPALEAAAAFDAGYLHLEAGLEDDGGHAPMA